jgi:hypothetical protein
MLHRASALALDPNWHRPAVEVRGPIWRRFRGRTPLRPPRSPASGYERLLAVEDLQRGSDPPASHSTIATHIWPCDLLCHVTEKVTGS